MLLSNECAVCRSSDVYDVTDAIEAGEEFESIAEQTGLSVPAIEAHYKHLTECGAVKENESTRKVLLETLRRNAARLEVAIKLSQRDGDKTLFLRASAELTKNIALQDNLANGTYTEQASTETAQIRSLARKMLSAVSDSPEMRNAIQDALKRQFGDDDENMNYEYQSGFGVGICSAVRRSKPIFTKRFAAGRIPKRDSRL